MRRQAAVKVEAETVLLWLDPNTLYCMKFTY